MPKTRTDVDRDAKVAEILDLAEGRVRDGGYAALSIAAIARELGLAQNALYWYFPSKDHLFVGALERMMRGIVARKPPRGGGIERQVMWFVDRLAEHDHVRAAMYDRARVSPVVAEFVEELNATWRRLLAHVLTERVPADELDLAVDMMLATINGALSQHLPAARRRRVVTFALERLNRR